MKDRHSWIGISILLATMCFLTAETLSAQDYDPPDRAARIAYLRGDVSMLFSGTQEWTAAIANYPMLGGDRIYTGDDARAAIQSGPVDVRVGQDSDLTLTNLDDNYEQLGLAEGSIRVRVFSLQLDGVVEVDTPNGAVIIQQPGDYRINAYPDQDGSMVEVNLGSVQITGPGVNQVVDEGQAVQMQGSDPVELGLVEMPYEDDLDQWSADRDRHILHSVSARYVSTDIPGYDDLDDYGTWASTPQYGPVWYPTNVPYGWAPYTFGHWANVAPWGWTWVDNAPWGFAPFHYGRWADVDGRWGWVPGPRRVAPVYSPALVAFVGGGPGLSLDVHFGGGGVAAWFPIGVGEPYVPWYHCSPHYVRQVNVTNVNVTVIRNTTIVNNYNTFITNTRTVNNITQINATNIRYVNRERVVAVPANMMAAGVGIQHAQVRLNSEQERRLATAPVAIGRPPVQAPARPVMVAKTNVMRPVAAPRLVTPRGRAAMTPAANVVRFNPASLPKPRPSEMIRPAARPIAPNLRPANPGNPYGQPGRPMAPAQQNPQQRPSGNPRQAMPNETRPGQPYQTQPYPQNQPQQPNRPYQTQPYQENRPQQNQPYQAQPQQPNRQQETQPYQENRQPQQNRQQQENRPYQTQPYQKNRPGAPPNREQAPGRQDQQANPPNYNRPDAQPQRRPEENPPAERPEQRQYQPYPQERPAQRPNAEHQPAPPPAHEAERPNNKPEQKPKPEDKHEEKKPER